MPLLMWVYIYVSVHSRLCVFVFASTFVCVNTYEYIICLFVCLSTCGVCMQVLEFVNDQCDQFEDKLTRIVKVNITEMY